MICIFIGVNYVGGHKQDKDRWFTIERVYGVLLSKCLADRCLLYI